MANDLSKSFQGYDPLGDHTLSKKDSSSPSRLPCSSQA